MFALKFALDLGGPPASVAAADGMSQGAQVPEMQLDRFGLDSRDRDAADLQKTIADPSRVMSTR